MRIRSILLAALALAVLAPTALAQDLIADRPTQRSVEEAPSRFTYSGLLTTADGTAIADGSRAIVFRGYASAEDARMGAAPAWEESHEAAVVGGRFLTVLGSRADVPADVRYLTVSVDGEAPSVPVRLDREANAEFAPGNTLQDSYLNGRTITTGGSTSAVQIQGPANTIGLTVRDVTAVFTTAQLTRFRLTSTSGGGAPGSAQIWEYRVYGDNHPNRAAGTFAITDATGGGADGFVMETGVGEDVLTLTGQTAQIGSPAHPASLKVYTTANPADPTNGFVTFTTQNFPGFGAASNWTTEDGLVHTRIEPDGGGNGGYFSVANGSGGSALTVNGEAGGGSRTVVGSGATASIFDDTETGDGSVVLPARSVSATETFNEAGVANGYNPGYYSLTNTAQATMSRTIVAPAAGYVIVLAFGQAVQQHTMGDAFYAVRFGISRDCSDPVETWPLFGYWSLPYSVPSGGYQNMLTAQGLFSVEAGANTFCIVALGEGGTIGRQQLTLLYVPTAYGSIRTNLDDGAPEEARAGLQPALTAGDLATERAASIEANEARESAEMAALRARVDALEASMGNDPQNR